MIAIMIEDDRRIFHDHQSLFLVIRDSPIVNFVSLYTKAGLEQF